MTARKEIGIMTDAQVKAFRSFRLRYHDTLGFDVETTGGEFCCLVGSRHIIEEARIFRFGWEACLAALEAEPKL